MFYSMRLLLRLLNIFLIIAFYFPLILLNLRQISDLVSCLGIFYIKVAQIITTRPDIFGNRLVEYFRKLQDQVPRSQVVPKIKELIIDENPIACGSIAEVYNCTFESSLVGEFVVKVKRQHINDYLDLDKDIINFMMNTMLYKYIISYFWNIGMVEHSKNIMNLIYNTIDKHLDFPQEVINIKRMKQIFSKGKVNIPQVYENHCSENHIIMEKIVGVHLSQIGVNEIDNYLNIFLNAVYDMIFIHNIIHGDLHEGNILATADGIVFIDLGIIHEIDPEKLFLILEFFASLHLLNADRLSQHMYINSTDKTNPYDVFRKDIDQLMQNYDNTNPNLYEFLTSLINICYSNNLNIEESLLYPFLILIEADGISRKYSRKNITMSKIITSRI